MLRFLRIRNLAVVEGVDVDFSPGFTVLTGETGAGKSIVVEAVGLLLGGRASADMVRTGEAQATIEAIFEDAGEEVVIRRELTAQGRSRAFVNGELTTSAALRVLASRLVELHGQHEHQSLMDPATHIPALDEYGRLSAETAAVAEDWEALKVLRERCDRATMDQKERTARLDLIAFQLGEIDKAAPKSKDEDAELAATRQVLANAERVQRLCTEGYTSLYENDASVLAQLAGVWRRVDELAEIDSRFAAYGEMRDSVKAQLNDLATELRSYGGAIDASPRRLQEIEERLATLDRVKKKYGPTLEEVIARRHALRDEHAQLTDPQQDLDALLAQRDTARARYLASAQRLSTARRKAGELLASGMSTVLGQLGMARAQFEMRIAGQDVGETEWSASGIDSGEFFIAPNPGEAARPLARIVSGGELSRIMLALKTLGADDGKGAPASTVRTLVFDEVDAGIGGQVAEVVARHLQGLGSRFQVLCVTHLPQIAARAAAHYAVAKQTAGDRTRVSVSALDESGRVEELARMIGGVDITEPLRASARELIGRGLAVGAKAKEKAKGESERRRATRQ